MRSMSIAYELFYDHDNKQLVHISPTCYKLNTIEGTQEFPVISKNHMHMNPILNILTMILIL